MRYCALPAWAFFTICTFSAGEVQPLKKRVAFEALENDVISVAFSPDGKWVASGDCDNDVRLWNVRTKRGRLLRSGHSGHVWSVAFSPDARNLASGSLDGTIKLWELATNKERITFRHGEGLRAGVACVSFSPSGRLLASAGGDGTIKIWDVGRGKLEETLLNPELVKLRDAVSSLTFSPDSSQLIAGDSCGFVKVWDIASGKAVKSWRAHEKTSLLQVICQVQLALSPDGMVLATAAEKEIKLWDIPSGKQRCVLTGHQDDVSRLAFHPKGSVLASAGYDGTIRLWNVATGKEITAVSSRGDGWVLGIAFNSDGTLLASGGADFAVTIWEVAKF